MMVPEEDNGGGGVCHGCLSTHRRMISALPYADLYFELTNVQFSEPELARLCYECLSQLTRAVRVRRRMLRSHALLADYAERCAPFPMDPSDKELCELAEPMLSTTDTLTYSLNTKRHTTGFHLPLTHVKRYASSFPLELAPHTKCEVKQEADSYSDYEDHISLGEFKDLSQNAEASEVEVPTEPSARDVKLEPAEAPVAVPIKKKKKKDKHDRKKRLKRERVAEVEAEPAARVRKAVDVDPEKIRLIQLDPVEQVRARAAAAASAGFLRFPFRCELCYRGFNYEAKLQNHMNKHDPARGKFECKLCSMYLPTIYSYKVHMVTHTTRYECRRCGKQMIDRGCIVEHYETAHEGKVQHFSCRLCGKVSSNSKTHRGHMRNHHSGDRPSCDQCGKTFVNKDSLSEHILIHQGIKNHSCDSCEARFRTKTQLKHHQLKHTSARDFYCVECDVRFKSAHNLRQHLSKSRKHRDVDTLQFGCPRCPQRFESARALEHHIVFGHEGQRLYRCAECGAQLATRNSLAKHTRVAHQGYRAPLKHVCDTCGRAFRGKNVLVNHMRTHTGEKPYECSECGRKFSQRTAMRTHVKLVHLKMKRGGAPRIVSALKMNPPLSETPMPKEELPVAYEPWARTQPDVFYIPAADS